MKVDDIRKYVQNNQEAMDLYFSSNWDYLAARCCAHKGQLFHNSNVLGSYALEKTLKAFLLLLDPKTKIKNYNHKLASIVEAIDKLGNHNLGLDKKIFIEFENHFNARYPDNLAFKTNQTTNHDIKKLDDLYLLKLFIKIPIPNEVKFHHYLGNLLFHPFYENEDGIEKSNLVLKNDCFIKVFSYYKPEYEKYFQQLKS